MLERVMRSTTVSLDVTIAPAVEERRLLWTAYDNLNTWFLGFKEFLLKFGFATLDDNTGELIFSPEMLRRIINVDETEASLDRSNTQAGGRTAMSYRDPHLPQIMKSVAKSSFECTAIFGSSPAGELVPIHFQLPTSATSAEREKLRYDFCLHIKKYSWAVWSRRGSKVALWDCNEQEGWDE
jgi:hypothetical protein